MLTSLGKMPLRVRVPGLLDVLLVQDSEQMRWLNQHPSITRPLDPTASWLHRILDGRLRTDLGFDGQTLPVFLARSDEDRATRQVALERAFAEASELTGSERKAIAACVSGKAPADDIGVKVQQWCGRLFFKTFHAAPDTYEAGRLLADWPSTPPWRTRKARKSGRLARAKATMSVAAHGDLHCVHGASIGMENVARSVRKQREAHLSPVTRQLTVDEALRHCLVAPPAVLRGCTADIHTPFMRRALTPRTLVVFLVARAYETSGDLDAAFLGDSWSACPARHAIPDMLRDVWATAQAETAQAEAAQMKKAPHAVGPHAAAGHATGTNGGSRTRPTPWSRLWSRGTS